jgi:hypothetical protein
MSASSRIALARVDCVWLGLFLVDVDQFKRSPAAHSLTIPRSPMRNRTNPRKTRATPPAGAADMLSSSTQSSERSQIDASSARPDTLVRTPTREEIVQTDGDAAIVQSTAKRPWTQYRRIIFIMGCFIGVVLAWVFQSPDLQLEGLLDSVDVADFFDDIRAALPSALPISLVREARQIQEHSRQTAGTGAFSIGEQMWRGGMSAHYPVVMVGLPFLLPLPVFMTRFRASFLRAWKVGLQQTARKCPGHWPN